MIVTLVRRRHTIKSLFESLKQSIRTIQTSISLLSTITQDLKFYLTSPTTQPPPQSLQRLLHLAASPDGQSIINTVISSRFSTPSSSSSSGRNNGDIIGKVIIPGLATVQGRIIISSAVSSAVKQLMTGFRSNSSIHVNNDDIINVVSNEKVKKLLIDIVQTITNTAIPHIIRRQPQRAPTFTGPQTVSKQSTSTSKRLSISSSSSLSSATTATSRASQQYHGETGGGKSVPRSNGRGVTFWERLAIIAIRDKSLMQDIVRIIVTQSVRTYVMTHAELNNQSTCTQPPSSQQQQQVTTTKNRNNTIKTDITPTTAVSTIPVWKMLATTVAVDIRRLMHKVGTKQASNTASSSGWTVF